MAKSKVENLAQVMSCQLKFVHGENLEVVWSLVFNFKLGKFSL
jgi:hypothetical protein